MAFDTFELNLYRHDMKGKRALTIVPIGDNHDDVGAHVDDHLKDVKARTAKMDKDSVLFLLMGDYGDFMSTSERAKIAHSGLHDTTIERFDDMAMKDLKKRYEEFKFMKGRIIGVHCGNHDYKFQDGRYASEILAEMLEARHLGYVAYTVLKLDNVCQGGSKSRVDLVSCHGKSGGRLLGSSFNSLERMALVFHDADIYFMGHDHSKGALPDTRMHVDFDARNNKLELKEKVRYFVRTGSAMRGYIPGRKTYVSRGLYKPCALGFPMVFCEFKITQKGKHRTLTKEIHSWS